MKKNEKKLIVIGLIMAFIAFGQALIYYYGKFGGTGIAGNNGDLESAINLSNSEIAAKYIGLSFLSLKAAINCFLFNPSLSPADVYNYYLNNKDIHFWYQFIAALYSAIVLLAPLFTVYVSIRYVFQHWWWTIVDKIYKGKKERIYVFGLNKKVKNIIEKEYNYIIYCSEETSNEMITEIRDRNVHVHRLALDNEDKFKKIVNEINKENAKVFFMEESDLKNFEMFCAFDKVVNNSSVNMYLLCEKDSIRKAIIDYSDTYKKSRNLHVFSTCDLKVNCIMQYEPVYKHIKYGKDFHAIIIGFSQYGQSLLKHIINDAVYASENTITIDVFDYNVDKNRNIFYSSLKEDMVNLNKNSLSIREGAADGKLIIQFHNMDVNHYPFKATLKQFEGTIDIAYVCIDDEDKCTDAILQLKDTIITYDIEQFPVIASIPNGDNLLSLLSNYKELQKDKIEDVHFCLIESKKYFNLNTVIKGECEKQARAFNDIYNSLNIITRDDPNAYTAAAWELLPDFKKYSNYLAVSHQYTIEKVIKEKYKYDIDKIKDILEKDIELRNNSKENEFIFSFDKDTAELTDKLNAEPFIKEMCRIEHRRWCYERILTGWKYSEKKNDSRRVTPCLANWEGLCANNEKYCKYDLLPVLYLMAADNHFNKD